MVPLLSGDAGPVAPVSQPPHLRRLLHGRATAYPRRPAAGTGGDLAIQAAAQGGAVLTIAGGHPPVHPEQWR